MKTLQAVRKPPVTGPAIPLPSPEKLVELLGASDLVKGVLADEHAKQVERRTGLVAELAALERRAEAEFKADEGAVAAAITAHDAAQNTLLESAAKLRAAVGDKMSRSFARNTERQRIEAGLLESADPRIETFIAEMRDEADATRRAFRTYTADVKRHPLTQEKTVTVENNHAAVMARLDAIRAASEDAERLRHLPDQTAVPARLDALRVGLPKL